MHLIADEIAVGFGRTGTLFACEQARISPDFLCLSKGLTGGYLPLSVVMTSERCIEAFYAEYGAQRAFLHSHSYTGNALGVRGRAAPRSAVREHAGDRDTIAPGGAAWRARWRRWPSSRTWRKCARPE